MMTTYRVPEPCHPSRVLEALEAAGMKVATVRASWANLADPVALWAVVVFQEGYTPDLARVKALVDDYLQSPEMKDKKPSAGQGTLPDRELNLTALERL